MLGRDRETGVEPGQKLLEDLLGLVDGAGAGQAQLGDQPVLEGFQHPLHPSLGLRREGEYLLDAHLPHHPGELGSFNRHRLLTGVVLESRVAVAVEGQGDSPLPDQALQEHQVAAGVLAGAEDGLSHGAGGVVHGDEQRQLRSPVLQPGMVAAVDLHQHPLLGHAPAPEPVLLGAAAARTADACLDQNAAHRGTAQVDALAFPQQFGEMSMVGARVAVAGQLHHGSRGRLRDGVVGPTPPVPVGQCGRTVLAVSREEPLGMTFTHSHNLGCLGDGKLVFQNAVENLNPCLFLLIQRYIPHRDDIFADQLAGDRIVEHQQEFPRSLTRDLLGL